MPTRRQRHGMALARELREVAASFHPRSDARDILEYEAQTILLASEAAEAQQQLQSTLLDRWGRSVHNQIDAGLLERVATFWNGSLATKEAGD